MKGLRELDINGAHILSRAASSREETTCFKEVYDELRTVLGMGGVMEQVEAEDHVGRNIMMHAARGNHVKIFTQVYDLYQEKMMKPERWDSENEMSNPEEQWQEIVKKADRTGRTMLHHAAEAGCLEVLKKVIKIAEEANVYAAMTSEDGNDRTPLMLILRNSWGDCCGRNDQDAKFDELWTKKVEGGWMKSREINTVKKGLTEHRVEAKTELFHAVRGGSASLTLFLKHVLESDDTREKIDVAEALGLKEIVDPSREPNNRGDVRDDTRENINVAEAHPIDGEELRRRQDGILLASAAKGGHKDVMKKVVSAINVSEL